jgi:hypothetical protein
MCAGWWVALVLMLATPAGVARAQTQPPTEPIPRVETGMHNAQIWRIGIDASCRLMVTGSDDKTARLWALPEQRMGAPKLLRVLRVPIGPGNDGKIWAVALSPDGRFVAAGGWNRSGGDHWVYVFDAATGKLIRRLGKLDNVINHLTWSADGRYLAATLNEGEGLRVWETADWSLVGDDWDYGGKGSYGVAFDATDRLYTVAYDGLLRRYGGADFKLEGKWRTLGGKRPYSVAVHPNGDRIAVVFDDSTAVEVYRAKDMQRLFAADTADVSNGNFFAVAWSADGARLYAGGKYQDAQGADPVRIWAQEGHGKGRDVAVSGDSIMQLLPCRDKIAVGAGDPAFGLISLAGEKLVWQGSAIADMRVKLRGNFTVSNDGSRVRFGVGVGNESPVLFDLAAGRLTDQPQPAAGLAEPDTASLKLSDWENDLAPKLNRKPLIGLENEERARSVAIAPGADRFVLGTDYWIRAFDKNGKELWRQAEPGVAWGVNIPRDGRFVVVAYGDGTIRWLRLSDGEEVLALFVNAQTREWVLWTPQGYYGSSVAGDQNIGWQLNKGWEQAGEFVTAAQLKKHFYRPDIIKRAFDLADADAAVREAGLSGFKLADLTNHTPPKFRIGDPGDKSHADRSPVPVKIELAATDDPVTGFDVTVNGRQVTPRAVRDLPLTTEAQIRALNIPLEKGENHIQVTAHNKVGDSVQDLLVYLDREGVLDKKGKLFVLAIGVDKYPKFDSIHWLHYAAADARLMLDTLTKQAGPLHTEVRSKLLVTGGDTPPTKANIEDALLFFHDAGPDDTVVLFLAGHGENEKADYLFMPQDAEEVDKKYFRPSTVVKWSVLQQALQDAQGIRIMFVDTCHSRGAYNSRLIKDAADANIVVFSATDSATEAQEDANLGHGIFTYALAEGLNGKAAAKGAVNITGLFNFVSGEVSDLSKGEQEPTFSAAGVKNFVVARP